MDVGALRHLVTLENPGVDVPDGDGGYTQVDADLIPDQVWASIVPATARDMERVVANVAVQTTATHLVRVRYHPGITTQTKVLYGTRVLYVTGIQNVDERNIELVLVCTERVS
jgi:head-tail adaptor